MSLEVAQLAAHREDWVWVVLYGSLMSPAELAKRLIGSPAEFASARVEGAWLAWDVAGVPFLNACRPNAIIRGLNDGEWRRYVSLNASSKVDEASDDLPRSPAYARFLHDRCSPGQGRYAGQGPPPCLEGIAARLSHAQVSRLAACDPDYAPVPIQFASFEDGDPSRPTGTHRGLIFVARPHVRRLPHLAPSTRTFSQLRLPAFFRPLSREYLAQLMDCKTFDWPPHPRGKVLGRRFYAALLAPAFVLLYLPIVVFGAHLPLAIVRLLAWALAVVHGFAVTLDMRVTRHVFGSGLTHD